MGQFLVESVGDYAPVAYPASDDRQPGRDDALPMQDTMQDIATEMFFRRTAIHGGTSEIQRSIIAKWLLRM
ncbi:hypothetical protein KB879_34840 (plasmid) [Cupriavidus sp. KK10]|uniref:hypothetical protein n=1 Tax=Cupriavidus sp. KK10 TaxID=1478019 RepID=UPI001BA5F1CE|nr:hypothetical protein [Cupriavidus sp. KK10]QUN32747.1 hypothetical protein KB879_34840 [Cupriavidus sp. KK10]